MEERGIHEEAVQFQGKAQLIDVASDGVKAFTGMVSELIAGDPKVVLIDEPEAFLHPSLAFKLGLEVSRAALKTDKRVFVSTHSPDFVMGCIQSGAPVNIIRLTYRGGNATARSLPSEELLLLMRNPLLRSTGYFADCSMNLLS
jgi:predicted ATPase